MGDEVMSWVERSQAAEGDEYTAKCVCLRKVVGVEAMWQLAGLNMRFDGDTGEARGDGSECCAGNAAYRKGPGYMLLYGISRKV